MRQGFVKVAAVTPKIRVADPVYNAEAICGKLEEAYSEGARIIVFPELCLTGYTCGDLFLQQLLLDEASAQLLRVAEASRGKDALVAVGLPVEREGGLYNAAAVIWNGEILGFVPKSNIPDYAEFYEGRHFSKGNAGPVPFVFAGKEVPFGADILFTCENLPGLTVAFEICEDLWVAEPTGTGHALRGATVLANLSASDETVGKDEYRELLVKSASVRLICGYIYSSAGEGESTQDMVFGGHSLIAENGTVLAQEKRFECGIVYGDLDIQRLDFERRKMKSFGTKSRADYAVVPFRLRIQETELARVFDSLPFVPSDEKKRRSRCEEILSIQSCGLKKRLEHTGLTSVVLGISGGLDSTLALMVAVRAFDMLGLDRKGIRAVTMPCFGTTDRTYHNACRLAGALGVTFREIDVREAVTRHFEDIGQDADVHDAAYENAQARERTQVLMDIANQVNGLVIGTGDMSELALGWTTYNGDHMSMYGVNAGVPKTLVRHLVQYCADTCGEREIAGILKSVLETPVSPELLPPVEGEIAQKTEELVGPYELHDFFLYYMLRWGFSPAKVYRVARIAFEGQYNDETVLKWLKVFYRRFFRQQFKRSCLPDGPKVGSVALSPRGDFRMPSDACERIWMDEAEELPYSITAALSNEF